MRYIWLLLFTAVKSDNVPWTLNEQIWKHCSYEKRRVSFLSAFSSFSSTDQHITLFCASVQGHFNTVFIPQRCVWPTTLWFMLQWSLSNTSVFFVRHITIFLCLGTLCTGDILNSKTNKKHKNVKKVLLGGLLKDICYSMRADTRTNTMPTSCSSPTLRPPSSICWWLLPTSPALQQPSLVIIPTISSALVELIF